MLFDLRGKGRRRTVQVIYLSLAILMGGGLVLFGIGGATSGGLFDAFSSDSGTQNVSSTYEKQVKTYTEQGQGQPEGRSRPGPALTRAQVQQAGVTGYEDTTGTYTADGLKQLQAGRELLGDVPRPRPEEARRQPRVAHGQHVRRQRAERPRPSAAQALALVIDERGGSSALYTQLAVLYYTAGNVRKSVLAERRRRPPRRPRPAQARQGAHRRAAQADRQGQAPGRRPAERPRRRAPAAEHPAAPSGYHHTSARAAHRPREPAPVAQLAEQRTLNPKVLGSIPSGGMWVADLVAPAPTRLRGAVAFATAPARRCGPCIHDLRLSGACAGLVGIRRLWQDRVCALLVLMVW